MAVCGKCKVAPPHSGNKWCLGCLAWEVIEKELGAPWPSAAHRAVGEDLVLTCCRALHRIRLLGSVDPEAPAVTPQVEAAPAPGAPATTGAVRALRVGGKGVEVEEYSYYSTEQEFVKSDPNSVKEELHASTNPSSGLLRPALPRRPRGPDSGRGGCSRHAHSEPEGEREKGGGKGRKKKKKNKRGGRKHQRLYRDSDPRQGKRTRLSVEEADRAQWDRKAGFEDKWFQDSSAQPWRSKR